jgi:signal transduction histidine kinase
VELRLDTADLQPGAVRRQVARFLEQDASEDSDFAAAELIIGELLGNVIRHAPGPIRVRAEWEGPEAKLVVEDSGRGFSLPQPPAGRAQQSGRGLALVQAFARSLLVRYEPGRGTTVEVVLPLERSKPPARE